MDVYIKSKRTFVTRYHFVVSDYVLYYGSSNDKRGKATIPAELNDITGDWFYAGGRLWVIDSALPDKGFTTIKLALPVHFFSRTMFIPAAAATAGAFIVNCIRSQFVQQTDTAYRFTYINITNTSTVPFFDPTDDEGTFNLAEYMATAEFKGVKIEYVVGPEQLIITIKNAERPTHRVFFNDGNAQLEKSQFSAAAVAKVTVRRPVDDKYSDRTYYLGADGHAYTTAPAQRAEGEWQTVVCTEADDPQQIAEEIFAENVQSYKVVFQSLKYYDYLDSVELMLPTGRYNAVISEVYKRNGDGRYYYECGQKALTMTDTIQSVTSTVSQVTGGSFNTTALEAYPIGAIYISTVDVSPAALFGGTWRKLQGRFLLGASPEYPAGSTGGEKQHTLTVNEMPAHTHSGLAYGGGSGNVRGSSAGGLETGSTGGGQPFNIMPPYLSVYMFERTG